MEYSEFSVMHDLDDPFIAPGYSEARVLVDRVVYRFTDYGGGETEETVSFLGSHVTKAGKAKKGGIYEAHVDPQMVTDWSLRLRAKLTVDMGRAYPIIATTLVA